ncbi:TPA: hypothetical protein DCE37_05855 [Candidatus Latescibacteria bacterium]|nr:hypothetical protein [Candidatus Latescibacterota bacterium]
MDYSLCRGVGLRITRHALMYLIDGDRHWIDAVTRQTDALFDDAEYPAWNHVARMISDDDDDKFKTTIDMKKHDVHLRTGMLAHSVSLTLNWLLPHLTPEELDGMVRGLEKRAIRPFQAACEREPWWLEVNNNWLTCIVGGLGVCGMALDGLHPDAQSLIDFAEPLMERHLEDYGSRDEFNEGVGYAGAIYLIVDYYAARLGWSDGQNNRLAEPPFADIATWSIQMALPPGRLYTYGDGHAGAPLKADWMPAIAAALQDPYLQGFANRHRSIMAAPQQLFYLDSDLKPSDLTGHLPLGVAYAEHGACISSHTSWDWDRTACVVGNKERRENNHEHNDPGQVVIDGEGQPLIVDWGTPETSYPAGFFSYHRFDYFEGSAYGHNVLVFGDREMESCYELHPKYTEGPAFHGKRALHNQGHIVASEFDDSWGGQWSIDTTAAWSGVVRNLRTVLHIHPGFVIVLDEAQLEETEAISLRWNTARDAALVGNDGFSLQLEGVGLAARVIDLGGDPVALSLEKHQYHEPWNKDQFGNVLPERDCPYVEARIERDRCRLLSMFCVQPGNQAVPWTREGDTYSAQVGDDRVDVKINDDGMDVRSEHHDREWEIPFISAELLS